MIIDPNKTILILEASCVNVACFEHFIMSCEELDSEAVAAANKK